MSKKLVNFGEAVEALKQGKRVRRSGWNESSFIFRQVPSIINMGIVSNMTSLPAEVKEHLTKEFEAMPEEMKKDDSYGSLKYNNQIAYVSPLFDVESYTPRVADVFAEDWIILD